MTSAMMVSMLAGCGSTGGETTTPEGGETAESGDGYTATPTTCPTSSRATS